MAEKRMICKSISVSEDVNNLPDLFDMLLFSWMIPHADDFGRLPGSPAKVKGLVIPLLDKTKAEVSESLERLDKAKLIIWYEIDGEKYIQMTTFEKHQSGLHKRTKSKFPEPPDNSGKFPEIPLEGKGREEKGTRREEEEKGRELNPSPDSNPHKDHLHELINKCKVEEYTLHHLDIINSYIGVVDIEVIETAIKKGTNKHINYTINTLKGMVKDGITTKEQILPKPEVGDRHEESKGQLRHEQDSPENKPITGGKTGALPSRWADKVVQLPNVSG